jgi:hypothetical protein
MSAMRSVALLFRIAVGCVVYVVVWFLTSEVVCRSGLFVNCRSEYSSIWFGALFIAVGAIATEAAALPFVVVLRRAKLTRLWSIVLLYALVGVTLPTVWIALTSHTYLPSLLAASWFLAGAAMGAVRYNHADTP